MRGETWLTVNQEAIKDTTPATITAEDDVELLEAEEEGGMTEATTKAKKKTKGRFMGVLQKAGKKMAGFHGDVSVDGTRKHVSDFRCMVCRGC